MEERTITIDEVNPVELYGVNEKKLEQIRKYFPKLKLIARGDKLKILGEEETIDVFEHKLRQLIQHLIKFHRLNENNIERIMEDGLSADDMKNEEDAIVFTTSGSKVKPLTKNQNRLVQSVQKNDIVFAVGPAGTGKTYTAVALAVKAFKQKEVKRIILTRPAVEAGENIGFLPGDLKEKLDPYLQPLYDALRDMVPAAKLNDLLFDNYIQIAPLAFMRGRTLDNAFVILDEAQNATGSQMKMFLTRMGKSAQFVITGDITQVDLPRNQQSGLITAERILKNIEGIDFVYFDEKDVVRHRLVKSIIKAYEKEGE